MIKYAFLFVLAFGGLAYISAQINLVPNPGFEGQPLLPDTSANGRLRASIKEYKDTHPDASSDHISSSLGIFPLDIPVNSYAQGNPGDYLVEGWFQPTEGTSDFWNSNECSPHGEKFPAARKQGGKIGMVFKLTPEYIETQLTEPLEAGVNYYLEFYIRPPKASMYQALTTIGALLTRDKMIQYNGAYIKAQPQIMFCDTIVLNDSYKWHKISGCFTAKGGEEFLTIGVFDFNTQTKAKFEPFIPRGGAEQNLDILKGSGNWWYYLLDDVMLTEDHDCEMFESPKENVTFLIDVSASMYRGEYIDALKGDIESYLLGAGKNTEVSILSFAATVTTLASHVNLKDEHKLTAVLDSLLPGSKTNIQEGLRKAFEAASNVKDTTIENRMILLTDASFTLDETAIGLIQKAMAKGITFTVFHYGEKPNEILNKLIQRNGGEYHSSSQESLQKLLVHKVECPCKIK